MSLIRYEIRKILGSRTLLVTVLALLCANVFLIYVRSTQDSTPPAALRGFIRDTRSMNMDEIRVFLAERNADIDAFLMIDAYARGYFPRSGIEDALFEKYMETYRKGSYPLYTSSYEREKKFLALMESEFESADSYDEFLSDIQLQSQIYGSISIFSQSGTYNTDNINRTAEVFGKIEFREIRTFLPQKGVVTALGFRYTDIFLLACILILPAQFITAEHDNGMLSVIRTTPKGRLKTAAAKCAALALVLLVILILVYLSNFLTCAALYGGIGDLTRDIHSLPYFTLCPYNLTVIEYTALFLLLKWCVAVSLGFLVMAVMLFARRLVLGWSLSTIFLVVQFALHYLLDPLGRFGIIRTVNYITLLNVNEWFGIYRNLNLSDRAVSVSLVSFLALILFTAVFAFLFLARFSSRSLTNAVKHIETRTRKSYSRSVTLEEFYKYLVANGMWLFLLAVLAFQVQSGIRAQSYITGEEIFYRYYMENLTGPYTEEKYEWLKQEYELYRETYEMDAKKEQQIISEYEYTVFYYDNYSLYNQRSVYDTIIYSDIPYILSHKGAQFVSPYGYAVLFDLYDSRSLKETLLTCLLLCVCIPVIHTQEHTRSMVRLLTTLPLGRYKLNRTKLKLCAAVVLVITGLGMLPSFWQVARDYGLPAFFAPANSLTAFSAVPAWISVAGMYLISFLFRYFAGLFAACVVLAVSSLSGKMLVSAFSCLVLFCTVPLFAFYGFNKIKFASIYPLFAFPYLLTQQNRMFVIAFLVLFMLEISVLLYLIFGRTYIPEDAQRKGI